MTDKDELVERVAESIPTGPKGYPSLPAVDLVEIAISALRPGDTFDGMMVVPVDPEWIKTTDRLPEKPGKEDYEYIWCWIYHKGSIKLRPWNCEHLCWDDEYMDDIELRATEPSHWMICDLPMCPQSTAALKAAKDGAPHK